MSSAGDWVIGIDLGTTNSCASLFRNGNVEVIPTENGKKTTPSVVHFKGAQRTVGDAAKVLMARSKEDYLNTVYCSKRLIGRMVNDPALAKDLKVWPFKVVDQGGKPMIKLPSVTDPIPVEQISAAVLSSLKLDAERYLGCKVTKCVITVPAYFTHVQRTATCVAAKIAGLDVLRLVNEPTAAAYSYGLTQFKQQKGAKNIFIWDLGGGTFDVSILRIDNGKFSVIATMGDSKLGGEDVDNRLLHYCMKVLKDDHGVTLRPNDEKSQNALRKMRKELEKFKHSFATQNKVELFLDNVIEDEDGNQIDLELSMSRATFDKDICGPLVTKAMSLVQPVLDLAKLKKEDISTVLLVGGSTRLVTVKEALKQYFPAEIIASEVNPDEAVSQGAAILAGSLSKVQSQNPNLAQIDDITSLPIGVKLSSGKMSVMLDKSIKIPCQYDDLFTNARDGQDKITFEIYEGDDLDNALNNQHLGTLIFPLSKPYAEGTARVDATFKIDANGMLYVTAIDLDTNKALTTTIEYKASLGDDEINELAQEEEYLTTVVPKKENARRELQEVIKCVMSITEDGTVTEFDAADIDTKKLNDVIQWTKDAQKWLSSGFNFFDKNITPADFQKHTTKIKQTYPDVYTELLDMYDSA